MAKYLRRLPLISYLRYLLILCLTERYHEIIVSPMRFAGGMVWTGTTTKHSDAVFRQVALRTYGVGGCYFPAFLGVILL